MTLGDPEIPVLPSESQLLRLLWLEIRLQSGFPLLALGAGVDGGGVDDPEPVHSRTGANHPVPHASRGVWVPSRFKAARNKVSWGPLRTS